MMTKNVTSKYVGGSTVNVCTGVLISP